LKYFIDSVLIRLSLSKFIKIRTFLITRQQGLIIAFPEGYRLLFNIVNDTKSSTNSGIVNSGYQGAGDRNLSGTLCEYGCSSSYSDCGYSHTNRL